MYCQTTAAKQTLHTPQRNQTILLLVHGSFVSTLQSPKIIDSGQSIHCVAFTNCKSTWQTKFGFWPSHLHVPDLFCSISWITANWTWCLTMAQSISIDVLPLQKPKFLLRSRQSAFRPMKPVTCAEFKRGCHVLADTFTSWRARARKWLDSLMVLVQITRMCITTACRRMMSKDDLSSFIPVRHTLFNVVCCNDYLLNYMCFIQ